MSSDFLIQAIAGIAIVLAAIFIFTLSSRNMSKKGDGSPAATGKSSDDGNDGGSLDGGGGGGE